MTPTQAIALLCVIGAIAMGCAGQEGWGWFLFAGLLFGGVK